MGNFGFILINHFVADFLCQSRKMGEGKSSSMYWLSMHILVYTIVLGFLSEFFFTSATVFLTWILINSVAHFATDFVTSRMSTYFYKTNNLKWFWFTIGFDQLIHQLTLYLTFQHYGN